VDELSNLGFVVERQAVQIRTDRGEAAESCNIIARNRARSGREVVFCAHYDCFPNSPGANDNASVVFALLILARLLQTTSRKCRNAVEIVLTTAEEMNSQGLFHYLSQKNRSAWELVVSLDCVGNGTLFATFSEKSLSRKHLKVLNDMDDEGLVKVYGSVWRLREGDGYLLRELGLPAVCLGRYSGEVASVLHTPHDDFPLLKFHDIIDTAKVCSQILFRLRG
jgi:hypothetical protein